MTDKRESKSQTVAINFERRQKRRRPEHIDYRALAQDLRTK